MKQSAITFAIALASAGAVHAGSISDIVLKPAQSPTPQYADNAIATIGEPVAIYVAGSGQCSGLKLAMGDGSMPVILQGNLPLSVVHTYQGAGKMVISATPVDATPDCSGAATSPIFIAAKNAFKPGTLIWGGNGAGGVNVGKPLQKFVAQIGGSGHCDMVHVDFGDGTPVLNSGKAGFYPSLSYNWQPGTHEYRKAGTYTITFSDSGATACGTVTAQAHVLEPQAPAPTLQISPPILMAPVAPAAPAITPPPKSAPPAPKPKCPQGKKDLACNDAN